MNLFPKSVLVQILEYFRDYEKFIEILINTIIFIKLSNLIYHNLLL